MVSCSPSSPSRARSVDMSTLTCPSAAAVGWLERGAAAGIFNARRGKLGSSSCAMSMAERVYRDCRLAKGHNPDGGWLPGGCPPWLSCPLDAIWVWFLKWPIGQGFSSVWCLRFSCHIKFIHKLSLSLFLTHTDTGINTYYTTMHIYILCKHTMLLLITFVNSISLFSALEKEISPLLLLRFKHVQMIHLSNCWFCPQYIIIINCSYNTNINKQCYSLTRVKLTVLYKQPH